MPDATGSTTWPGSEQNGRPSGVAPPYLPDYVTLPARIRLHKSERVELGNHAAWAFIVANNGYDAHRDECDDRVVDDALSVFPNELGRSTPE